MPENQQVDTHAHASEYKYTCTDHVSIYIPVSHCSETLGEHA